MQYRLYWEPGFPAHTDNRLGLDYQIVLNTSLMTAELYRRVPEKSQWVPTHRHFKGGYYKVIGSPLFVSGEEPVPCVLYENERGESFVRTRENFEEGIRFERLY
jgi:hypothetical protein